MTVFVLQGQEGHKLRSKVKKGQISSFIYLDRYRRVEQNEVGHLWSNMTFKVTKGQKGQKRSNFKFYIFQ